MPPAFRNHLVPTACGTPAPTAASSLAMPAAIAAQNRRRSSRPATGGRPGDDNGARPDRSERRFRMFIATSFVKVLRRPLEFALQQPGKTGFVKPKGEIPTDAELCDIQDYLKTFDLAE